MLVGVLSDTHITATTKGLALIERLAATVFAEARIILHAGDIVDPEVLAPFSGKSVYAVRGNLDPAAPELPPQRQLTLGEAQIGLIHGWGSADGLEQRVLRAFAGPPLDCLVFGHSHYPTCYRKDGILFFNPGSPTDRRRAPWHTVGLLTLGATVNGTIIDIERGAIVLSA